MSALLNSLSRHTFIAEQIEGIKTAAPGLAASRQHLQDLVEAETSLRFEPRDRAALRAFIAGLSRRLRSGEIDDTTAYAGMNRLIMAAASNNPDVLNIIYAGA